MPEIQTDNYIRVCMSVRLICEAFIYTERGKLLPKKRLIQLCNDCAQSCLSVVSLLISNPLKVEENLFSCFLKCRECYNECLLYEEEDIEYCGGICDRCAETIKESLLFHLN